MIKYKKVGEVLISPTFLYCYIVKDRVPMLFPFYGRWRLGGYVVGDAVDSADFINDIV